jgi:hypothetical protein
VGIGPYLILLHQLVRSAIFTIRFMDVICFYKDGA